MTATAPRVHYTRTRSSAHAHNNIMHLLLFLLHAVNYGFLVIKFMILYILRVYRRHTIPSGTTWGEYIYTIYKSVCDASVDEVPRSAEDTRAASERTILLLLLYLRVTVRVTKVQCIRVCYT